MLLGFSFGYFLTLTREFLDLSMLTLFLVIWAIIRLLKTCWEI